MREFFSLDGSFNKYGGMLADTIVLSLMWLVFSIPVFTIGATTTAMFYVSTRRIANREGYITSDFWAAFKENFKKATVLWLMVMFAVFLLIFNIMNIEAVGVLRTFIFPAQIIVLIITVFMTIYIFPITARFDMGLMQTLKSAFFMANRHLLTTISCVALLVAAVTATLMFPPFLFVGPGAYAMLSSIMLVKVFKKYRPEMDRDPVIELQEIEAMKAEARRKALIGTYAERGEDEGTDGNNNEPTVIDAVAETQTEESKTFTVFRDGRIIELEAPSRLAEDLKYGRFNMKKYVCVVCGYVYDEEAENGVTFESLADDYACPVCAVGKDQFEEEK